MFRYLFFTLFLSLFVGQLGAQVAISGRITDTDGSPLVGANVLIEETQQGAITDTDGQYRLNRVDPGRYTLQVSYVGYQGESQSFSVPQNGTAGITLNFRLAAQSTTLQELTVSATRADAKTPMTYTNLNEEELQANNLGQDVPYLLRWTPSTVVTSDAGAGIGYTGIRIRGTDPTRINVTINGIPLNDAESQGTFWVDLPDFISSTSDVQIQRGVGTSTNGAGAFGATINLNTSKKRDDPYFQTNTSIGSFNTLKGNVEFGTGVMRNKFSLDGRLSRIGSDGYIDRARADLDSWYLSGAYYGEKSILRFNAFSGHEVTYQAWNGVPADLVDDRETRTFNSAGTEKAGDPYDNEVDDYRQTHYQLLYDQQLADQLELSLAFHLTQGEGFFEQYKAGEDLEDYGLEPVGEVTSTDLIRRRWLDNDFYGTVYALRYTSDDDRLTTTLGGGYHIYEGRHFGEVIWARFASNSEIREPYYDNDAEKRDFNIYGKVNYELLPDLNAYVDLQMRRVSYDFVGVNNQGVPVPAGDEMSFFNPKAGIFYQISPRTEAYGSFAVANREPNRNDYTENPIGSWPLPERLYNTEIGLRHRWNKAALGANVYHMDYRDQLVLNGQINDVGEYMRINVPKSYRLGLELVGGFEVSPRLNVNANVTLSRNKVDNYTEYVDAYDADFNWLEQQTIRREDTDLAFSPSVIAGGDINFQVLPEGGDHQLALSLLGKYVGKQYIDNSSDENNVLDAYWFSDFRLQYRWKTSFFKEIGLTFLVQNVFDQLYETNAWSYRYNYDGTDLVDQGLYPQAGRNYLLGLTIGF
ncbi:TonB-dependent receptor [Flavilitoribacter nigricans]|uniref:TonB-dependent receptor n=1 Tax=Flavilitoribacter nigricans (strain ATCC 23147 / DSM 23189 / NBRC 102662 / NCIMB 1420 / SS-2) TaxID=1122177 RepID=A0A2D0N0X5_FLAN2|nr:TonB-dependent receptor [Flavilitoribacter nigricans]PHN02028.1 TonB-dependent receptor [Flavilitoribacter nigricans DSM 23189 = NBRC 102662]